MSIGILEVWSRLEIGASDKIGAFDECYLCLSFLVAITSSDFDVM